MHPSSSTIHQSIDPRDRALESLVSRRDPRSGTAWRVNTIQIPWLRCVGFAIVLLLVWAHQEFIQGEVDHEGLVVLSLTVAAYSLVSWLCLRAYYRADSWFDIGLAFLVVDIPIWLLAVYWTGGPSSLLFFVGLVRVADQVGTTFRRVVMFTFLVPVAYGLLDLYLYAYELREIDLPTEGVKMAAMFLVSLFIAYTARTAQVVRDKMRDYLRIARDSYQELVVFSQALDESRSTNERKSNALARQASDLLEKNEELREANARAEDARLQAEMADHAKSLFLANMSHELRTPLNAVLGFTDLVGQEQLSAAQSEHLAMVRSNGERLSHLIGDLLDLARIEAGTLEIGDEVHSPLELFDRSMRLLESRFVSDEVRFEYAADDTVPPAVHGDPVRIQQVLVHLVDNAAKFTPQGFVIARASAKRIDSRHALLEFVVHDTGIGIEPEHLTTIFDGFNQVDDSATRPYGGAGLGLTIARRLVELMGGTVRVESRPEVGTRLVVGIPVEVVKWPTGRRMVSHRIETKTDVVRSPDTITTGKDTAGAGVSDDAVSRGVLVVEDNSINQRLMQHLLRRAGYDVEVADNGKEAIERLRVRDFDVVLMDMQMPVLDGYAATRYIKQDEALKTTPVVALTAHAMRGDREKCLSMGCDDFLSKPVSKDVLLRTVKRYAEQD